MPLQFVAQGPMALPVAGYQGLADVAGMGAPIAYWGLRAISNTYAASHGAAAAVVDVNGNNPFSINVQSNGQLNETDLATAIASYGANVPAHCNFLTEQMLSGNDLANFSPASDQPSFVQSALGGKSVLAFDATDFLTRAMTITQNQPFTIIGVMNRTSGSADSVLFSFSNANLIQVGFTSSAATGQMYAGTVGTFPVTDNAWNAVQCMFSDGSAGAGTSKAYVNGSLTSSITANTRNFGSTEAALLGKNPFGSFFPNCRMVEIGLWAGDKSAQFAAVDNNIRTYWGF